MYVDGEVIEKMIVTILEGFERIERKLDRMNRLKDCFDGDELLDNVDLCKLLNVTDRTLARYRSKKLIKYYIIDRRIYYRRPADILPQFRSTRVHEGARTEKISDKAHGIMLFGSAMRFVFVLTRELGSL